MEPVLPIPIHADQTGFIKGRYIGENISLISDLMAQTSQKNTVILLSSLDFRKALDTLE